MRSRKKDQSNLVRVGTFITAMTVILAIMVVSIGKESSIFASKRDLKARVTNVSNLKTGSYVELKGIRVGSVKDIIIISEDEVEITFTILEDQIKWIKQDSKISISSAGLVGDKFLEIYNGTKESPQFDPDKDVLATEDLADFKKIITKGESIATITERILTKFDLILTNMDDGQGIAKSVNSMQKASHNLELITKELAEAHLGSTAKNIDGTMSKLKKTTESLDRVISRIEKGPGTMNSMIFSDDLHDDLRALLGGAQRNKVIKYFIRESIKKSEKKRSND